MDIKDLLGHPEDCQCTICWERSQGQAIDRWRDEVYKGLGIPAHLLGVDGGSTFPHLDKSGT